LIQVTNCFPKIGEIWNIAGHTESGDFSPILVAETATWLGKGRLPEPAYPSLNQLVNGNMDVQWVELQGVAIGVESNTLSLLLPEGRQEISMPQWSEPELREYDKAVVRIRGALFAVWNAETHEVRRGIILMHTASITVEKPAPSDPFEAPEKTPRGLFFFDAKATPFQRIKVAGQVTYTDSKRVFMESDSGIKVIPASRVKLGVGDWVEAVGYPQISGDGPVLREALLRKTADGVLPEAALIPDSRLAKEDLASKRVRVQGNLASRHVEGGTLILQIQTRTHLFVARVANAGPMRPLRLGSRLSLTGIHVSDGARDASTGEASHFELLLAAPSDLVVISAPSWWTLQRLLSAVGALLVMLALAAVWITQLRRQVTQRTLQLQCEIRERERAERQHAVESERSRIARDLHDELGSSLTEINVLASAGQRVNSGQIAQPALFKTIADKSRRMVTALDGIVWAIDPEGNSLQSLADYLNSYTREYFANTSVVCRFKIPAAVPDAVLEGKTRHEVLMIVKETLNNIVRHAHATEVEFQIAILNDVLEICIADNGRGFDANAAGGGHGMKNRVVRLTKIGGGCDVESHAGSGTTVRIRLPIPSLPERQFTETNTPFG
jgi:signal transduction histidine kinase